MPVASVAVNPEGLLWIWHHVPNSCVSFRHEIDWRHTDNSRLPFFSAAKIADVD